MFCNVKRNNRSLHIIDEYSIFTKKLEKIFISLQSSQVTRFILKSWEIVGIIPNLENGEVKNVKIDALKVLNAFNFIDSLENSTFDDPLDEKTISKN